MWSHSHLQHLAPNLIPGDSNPDSRWPVGVKQEPIRSAPATTVVSHRIQPQDGRAAQGHTRAQQGSDARRLSARRQSQDAVEPAGKLSLPCQTAPKLGLCSRGDASLTPRVLARHFTRGGAVLSAWLPARFAASNSVSRIRGDPDARSIPFTKPTDQTDRSNRHVRPIPATRVGGGGDVSSLDAFAAGLGFAEVLPARSCLPLPGGGRLSAASSRCPAAFVP